MGKAQPQSKASLAHKDIKVAGCEFLTAVLLKMQVFQDVTQCGWTISF
jgi:hypothetical protein